MKAPKTVNSPTLGRPLKGGSRPLERWTPWMIHWCGNNPLPVLAPAENVAFWAGMARCRLHAIFQSTLVLSLWYYCEISLKAGYSRNHGDTNGQVSDLLKSVQYSSTFTLYNQGITRAQD
jgi:hypothetical protein